MRSLTVECDNCGRERPPDHRPATWWLLEDHGEIMRTGPLDFCSLTCLAVFLADPDVRSVYKADFLVGTGQTAGPDVKD